MFGAQIGKGVVIKQGVRIKYPWQLIIGDHVWIGECVWIENHTKVIIRNNCCISQGAYLCTGNHRWDRYSFDLTTHPIRVEDHCWIGAMTRISPGVTCAAGAVLTIGSVATNDLEQWHIHTGNPVKPVKVRLQPDTSSRD